MDGLQGAMGLSRWRRKEHKEECYEANKGAHTRRCEVTHMSVPRQLAVSTRYKENGAKVNPIIGHYLHPPPRSFPLSTTYSVHEQNLPPYRYDSCCEGQIITSGGARWPLCCTKVTTKHNRTAGRAITPRQGPTTAHS